MLKYIKVEQDKVPGSNLEMALKSILLRKVCNKLHFLANNYKWLVQGYSGDRKKILVKYTILFPFQTFNKGSSFIGGNH